MCVVAASVAAVAVALRTAAVALACAGAACGPRRLVLLCSRVMATVLPLEPVRMLARSTHLHHRPAVAAAAAARSVRDQRRHAMRRPAIARGGAEDRGKLNFNHSEAKTAAHARRRLVFPLRLRQRRRDPSCSA